MTILRSGLTWSSDWALAGESPYGRLCKLLIANPMSAHLMHKVLFKRRCNGDVRTRWSFLDLRPLHPEPSESLAHEIWSTCLERSFGIMTYRIAGDEHIRYCAECMDFGFHSNLFQIDALERCPLHGSPIVQTCCACGHPTPRFSFRECLSVPFGCPYCGSSFGNQKRFPSLSTWPGFAGGPICQHILTELADLGAIELMEQGALWTGSRPAARISCELRKFLFCAGALAIGADLQWGLFDSRLEYVSLCELRVAHPSAFSSPETSGSTSNPTAQAADQAGPPKDARKVGDTVLRSIWQNHLAARLGGPPSTTCILEAASLREEADAGLLAFAVTRARIHHILWVWAWAYRFHRTPPVDQRKMPPLVALLSPTGWKRLYRFIWLQELEMADQWIDQLRQNPEDNERRHSLLQRYAEPFDWSAPSGIFVFALPATPMRPLTAWLARTRCLFSLSVRPPLPGQLTSSEDINLVMS